MEHSTDLPAALRALAGDVVGDVHLVHGRSAIRAGEGVALSEDLVEPLAQRLLTLREPAEIALADGRVVVAVPVRVTDERPGYQRLLVVTGADVSRSATVEALTRGAQTIATHQRGIRAVRQARRETAIQLLWRAMSGTATSDELTAWARALRIEPRGHVACLVVQVASGRHSDLLDAADVIEDVADLRGVDSLIAINEDAEEIVAFLFLGAGGDRSTTLVSAVERAVEPLLVLFRGTVGRSSVIAQGMLDISRAVHDARRVCELDRLRRAQAPREEPGTRAPLSATLLLQDQSSVAALHASLLVPLESLDAQQSSNLVETLDVFLSNCGQWSASAAELGIHVNTLRYRLNRIEKYTGRDLGSMSDRCDFYLALRTRALAPDAPAGGPLRDADLLGDLASDGSGAWPPVLLDRGRHTT